MATEKSIKSLVLGVKLILMLERGDHRPVAKEPTMLMDSL